MAALLEARDQSPLSIERSPVQEEYITNLLPDYAYSQAINVFARNLFEQTFIPNGPGYREYRYVKEVKAGRVPGQILHDKLVTPDGEHYFDTFYRGPLLDLTKRLLGIPELTPAQNPDDAYTGNALVNPTHRFPIHVDTEGTISAVIIYPVDQKTPSNTGGNFPFYYRGGELVFSLNPNACGFGQLLQQPNKIVTPDRKHIKMACFDATNMPHGSTSIDHRSPPRYTIACTYFLPGYGPDSRSKAFQKTRSSVR
jgi:hypothetical protein